MKENEVEKGDAEAKTHTAAPTQSLASKKKFSWVIALPVMIAVGLVGIFIVFNTFAATLSPNTKTVQGIYTRLLNRTPPAGDSGIQYWATKIDKGTSAAAVESAIKATSEYKSKHPESSPAADTKDKNVPTPTPPVGTGTTDLTTEIKWVEGQCAALRIVCLPGPIKSRAQSIVSKKKTRAQVLVDLKNAAAKVGTGKSTTGISAEQCVINAYKPKTPDAKGKDFWIAQINTKGKTCAEVTSRIKGILGTASSGQPASGPKLTAAQCDKKLRKEFRVPEYDKPEKQVGIWLKNKYIQYQGYAAGYRPGQSPTGTGYNGWELGDEGKALLKDIVMCEKTSAQAEAIIKSAEGAKKWTAEKQEFFENFEKPIAKVYQDAVRAAIAANGGTYTCWYISKKTGKTVDMLSDPEFAASIPPTRCFTDNGLPVPPRDHGVDLVALYKAGKIDLATAAQMIQSGAFGICQEPSANPFAPNSPQPASCDNGAVSYTKEEFIEVYPGYPNSNSQESGGAAARQSNNGFGAPSGSMSNTR